MRLLTKDDSGREAGRREAREMREGEVEGEAEESLKSEGEGE
jgi:hypothetical protein